MRLSLIVAHDLERGIGKNNKLLWGFGDIPKDMRWFKKHTMGKVIIMGRKTAKSIGRPLLGRISIVLTRDKNYKAPEEYVVVHTRDEALGAAWRRGAPEVVVIGGGEIYRLFMPYISRIYLTIVENVFVGADTFYEPPIPGNWSVTEPESHPRDDKNKWDLSFEIHTKLPV